MKRFALIFVVAAFAAEQKRTLTVDWIMQGPALYGHAPQNVRWSRDSQRVYFQWKKYDAELLADPDTYVVNRDGSALRKLGEDEAKNAPPIAGSLAPDKSATVFVERGDVFLYDHAAMLRRAVIRTAEAESGARFWQDAKHIAFQRGTNLYLLSLEDGSLEQLTDIRAAGSSTTPVGGPQAGRPPQSDTGEQKGTDSQEFIKKEEKSLLAVIAEKAKKREEEEAKRKKENPRKPWTLGARQTVSSLRLSPDGKYVLAGISEGGDRNKRTIVPNYVTESSYTEDIAARDNVGDNQPALKLAVVNRETGEQKWVEFGDKARPVQLYAPIYGMAGEGPIVRARSTDNKDGWLLILDPSTAKLRELVHMHDDGWLLAGFGPANQWIAGNRVFFLWERDGYNHLYAVGLDGGEPKAITSGKWEIREAELSDDEKTFYVTTAEAGAAENQVYAVPVDGGDRRRLTTQPGGHDVALAPDGALADVYSYTNKPPELVLNGKAITNSPSPDFASYPWTDPPVVEIPARDGAKVPARLYRPTAWKRGGPLVVFVHGAGYLQNAHKRWSTYAREYMFHHLLMDRGYMVLDIDYRGSAGYGRDWRTGIYRYMGGKDLDDHVDGVKWAIKEHGVNPKRVGLYGGSYGGFITLMALFTQPDVFAAGAALRPVTDWAHYNHPYTSNILNLPQKDEEAYKRSSPIYHAAGLKGALLICHGMVDINVHYQDSVRLVQKLIELRKENWELAGYPVEDHGFVQPTSWADEYKRILKLFETNLKKP